MRTDVVTITEERLQELLSEAARRGAGEVLSRIGLSDERAPGDLRELRNLLDGWRLVKRGAIQSAARYLVAAILGGGLALAGYHLPSLWSFR